MIPRYIDSPCEVANTKFGHEVLKVLTLCELELAGDEVGGHDDDDVTRCCCVDTSVISRVSVSRMQ